MQPNWFIFWAMYENFMNFIFYIYTGTFQNLQIQLAEKAQNWNNQNKDFETIFWIVWKMFHFCENQEFNSFIYTRQRQSAVTNPNQNVLRPSRCELVNHNLIVHRFHSKIDNLMKNSPSNFTFFSKHVFLTINFSGASQFLHNDRVGPKLSNWERFEKKSQKCQNRVIILQNLFPSQNTFWALDKIVQPKKNDNSSK